MTPRDGVTDSESIDSQEFINQISFIVCHVRRSSSNDIAYNYVRNALKASREEGFLEGVSNESARVQVRLGYNTAIEEAARVADDHARIKGSHVHGGLAFCVTQVASDIRKLKKGTP